MEAKTGGIQQAYRVAEHGCHWLKIAKEPVQSRQTFKAQMSKTN